MSDVNKQLLDAAKLVLQQAERNLAAVNLPVLEKLTATVAAAEQAQQVELVAHVKIGNHAPILLGSDGLRIEGTPSGALKVTCTREHASAVAVLDERAAFEAWLQENIDNTDTVRPSKEKVDAYFAVWMARAMLAAAQKGGAA